jgi:hypothetical protein
LQKRDGPPAVEFALRLALAAAVSRPRMPDRKDIMADGGATTSEMPGAWALEKRIADPMDAAR